jgi:hypothetical protein
LDTELLFTPLFLTGRCAVDAAAMPFLNPPTRLFWRALQLVFFAVGAFILAALFWSPELGLHLLWNVLIPVAPALLVLAPGLWRNVCPMGTASMLPQHLRLSRGREISTRWQGRLLAGAVLLLIVIVPLRHVVLDHHGLITGAVLLAVALLAGGLGLVFGGRGAWCSGLCPVYPVEMLYGTKPAVTVRNAHCRVCTDCVTPCRDSKNALTPGEAAGSGPGRLAAGVLVGGFPGFIIGWYLVPSSAGPALLWQAYAYPLLGMAASLLVFVLLGGRLLRPRRNLGLLFAAAAVSAYYWFKLPVMLGLGEPSAALFDLSAVLPDWSVWPLRAGVIAAFGALLLMPRNARAWQWRPPRATEVPARTPQNRVTPSTRTRPRLPSFTGLNQSEGLNERDFLVGFMGVPTTGKAKSCGRWRLWC